MPAVLPALFEHRYGAQPTAAPVEAAAPAADLFASLLDHRSIRAYSSVALEPGTLELLIAAAQSASTSSNLQPWSVVALTDPAHKAKAATLAGDQNFIRQAPLFLIFVADLSRLTDVSSATGRSGIALDYLELFLIAAIDAALAAQNAVVAAEGLGLGTCYVGAVRNRPQDIADLIGLPQRAIALFGLAVGHPAAGAKSAVKPRLPQPEVLHRERYDSSQRAANVAAYDRILGAFYAAQGLPAADWSHHIAQRVGSIDVLRGRDQLTAILRDRGFGLR
ncbi:NADPH-dependent oxidoreductase [Planctomycetota bacterium]|nr:NADPH-dependent oxidoreductase [Planctomycetota bacterium]